MAKRDYYEVLGISKTASEDDIRKAYRKLARQFHPDVNKAADAQARFTEVQEAYDVLSDPQKRKMYDRGGFGAFAGAGEQPGPGRGPHYTWSNVGGGRVGDADVDLEDLGSMFEAFFGGSPRAGGGGFGDMGGFGGAGRRTGAAKGAKARARGAEPATPAAAAMEHEITVSFLTAARGGEERLRLSVNGKSRTIDVTIPKGINDGARLRVKGGAAGDGSDLILTVRIGQHPLLRRSEFPGQPAIGLDLYLDLPLTIAEATLGAAVNIPTLEGMVELAIPPGTASGRKLRLRGRGIEDAKGGKGGKGDLYAVIRIVPPEAGSLTGADEEFLRTIAAKGPSPRSSSLWTGSL
jgi:curved DNA-binding protein